MPSIELTRGYSVIVDEIDFEWASQFSWQVVTPSGQTYAKHDHGGRKNKQCWYMHRKIAERAGLQIDGLLVDHVDGDGLNNRRDNLRVASQSRNLFNRGRAKHNTSGYKGVSWDAGRGKWYAQIAANHVRYHLGRFDTVEEAAEAYAKAAASLHGEFARLEYEDESRRKLSVLGNVPIEHSDQESNQPRD